MDLGILCKGVSHEINVTGLWALVGTIYQIFKILGVPKKVKRLLNKGFVQSTIFLLISITKHFINDFENKFTQIWHELTKTRQFRN